MTSTASTTNATIADGSESIPAGTNGAQRRRQSKKSKHLGPKLIAIQGLVKRQRTKELQSDIFAFAERCLLDLNMEFLKKEGLTKLRSDDNYIPISVRIESELFVRPQLIAEQLSIDCASDFKDIVNDCQKKLAALVCQQVQKNYKVLEKQHRLDMLKDILKISSAMAGHLKIKLGEQDSSANKDVIAKAALLNLFHYGFDMMEKFHDDDKDDDDWTRNLKKNPIKTILFNGSIKNDDVTKLLTEVVEVGLDGGSKKWEPLLFSNHKTARWTELVRTYLESKQLPPVPTTTAVLAASATIAVPVMPSNNNNNNNNNNSAKNSTSVAPSNTTTPTTTGVIPQGVVGALFMYMPDGSFRLYALPLPNIIRIIVLKRRRN